MPKFPTLSDDQLQRMWKKIRLTARNSWGQLWYLDEAQIDPQRSVFNKHPKLATPADDLAPLMIVPMKLPLLIFGLEPEATVHDVFAQLVHPIHPEGQINRPQLNRVAAVEVTAPFRVLAEENCMEVYVGLHQEKR